MGSHGSSGVSQWCMGSHGSSGVWGHMEVVVYGVTWK